MTRARTLAQRAALGLVLGCAVVAAAALRTPAARAAAVPPPALDPAPGQPGPETAVLAGGCFWGVQAVFEHVSGVSLVVAGYSGGTVVNPTYEQVSTETTGHAESVRITFDPARVSYGTLLRVFFSVAHDPTEVDRQGPDYGPSYRSEIFYTNDRQKAVAYAYIAQLDAAHVYSKRIATRVDAFKAFYPAEDYHQDFLIKNPTYGYIVVNDQPKLVAFKRALPALYSEAPVRVH